MARVILSEAASDDEAAILTYLHDQAGWATASKFRTSFRLLYLRLAEYPDSGAPRPSVGAGIRLGVVAPYLVLYQHTAESGTVTVLRIVHGKRKISGRLLRS